MTCSRYEVVLLRHIRRQVGRPGGGQVQGEYIQVVERVPVEYQGVVTCVDSDGSTLIIGDSLQCQCSLPIIMKYNITFCRNQQCTTCLGYRIKRFHQENRFW